jgi:hypothetical protein
MGQLILFVLEDGMGHFKEKMLEHLKIKDFSPSTVKTYINCMRDFISPILENNTGD